MNPAPPGTAVPLVKAEKFVKQKKYVKHKNMRVTLTESQLRQVGELRAFYTDGPRSWLFRVQAIRQSGDTTLGVDIAKRFLLSKLYTEENAGEDEPAAGSGGARLFARLRCPVIACDRSC